MKTTQQKALTAFQTINRMGQNPLNTLVAYKLFKLKKALYDSVEFQIEQERSKVDELGGTITETGQIKLDKENMKVFAQWHRELEEMECEIDSERIEISMRNLKDISLSDMEALEEFVDWKE